VLLGTQVAPVVVPEDVPVKLPPLPPTPPPADIPVPPPRPIWETIFRLGPRAGILIAAILTPSETRDFESFIHYSYLEQRFSILSGLRNGAWAAKPPVLSGARAQQVYALPIHDQDDLPPDTYFQLWLIDGFPKQVKIETIPTIVTNTQYGLVRTREGGGVSYRLLAPVPPGMISGPFDLPN
ncbi:MAG TPA: hypothetical protein VFO94_02135, partial [Gammaproteobacteria bacterium]|nr:hypothetical protein [Gammaproteobacteria bacterium]